VDLETGICGGYLMYDAWKNRVIHENEKSDICGIHIPFVHALGCQFNMADIRRNTKEANQVYQMARQAISQNGSIKDTIAGFLRDFEVDGMSANPRMLHTIF
jgi:hypothetical protein